MKKFAVVLIFGVFILFAFLGFKAASSAKQEEAYSSMPANAATALASTQQNYLLIHVDDLSAQDPQLIAVWGAFVYYAQPNQVMFLPLLPSYEAGINDPLYDSFSLGKNGEISKNFISQIQQEYDLQITGWVLVDNTSLAVFNQLAGSQETVIAAAQPENEDQKHILLLNAQSFFQNACTRLQNPPSDWINTVPWSQIAPAHFSTNIPFETIMVDLQKLTSISTSNQCSVLSSE